MERPLARLDCRRRGTPPPAWIACHHRNRHHHYAGNPGGGLRGGTATTADNNPGAIFVDGLLVEGNLQVGGQLSKLALSHCTVLPQNGPAIDCGIDDLLVEITRSICGSIELGDSAARLQISQSIVQRTGEETPLAINAPEAQQLLVDTCTVLGEVVAARLEASNSIFTDEISVQRQQEGCVRFCFVRHGSRTPRRYRCQPDLALSSALEAKQKANPTEAGIALTTAEENAILVRIVPSFTSEIYGHPGFCQLGRHIPDEIFTGADDASEIGVFGILKQAQRVTNLDASLGDYLPLGLESGIFFAT